MLKFKDFGNDIIDTFGTSNEALPAKMVDLADMYGKEKRSIEQAEAVIKQRKEVLATQEATLYALLDNIEIDSFSSGGYTFFKKVDMYATIDASREGVAFKWLEDEDFDYLIRRTVNCKSLSSAIKTVIEETGEMPGEDEGIKIRIVNRVGVRKK